MKHRSREDNRQNNSIQKKMKDAWTDRWDKRFSEEGFAYGEEPNNYFKEQLEKLKAGTILLPAEGEGRNAVYAAKLGWKVHAFDISNEGKKKALRLAEINHQVIDYQLGELQTLPYSSEQFDAIALIYAHFPANIKSAYHRKLDQYLRKGGIIIFEAFSKNHIEYLLRNEMVGGPKEIEMLFSLEEIKAYFPNYEFEELMETEIELKEGRLHNGQGSVIRFLARKYSFM